MTRRAKRNSSEHALRRSTTLIRRICRIAGSPSLLTDIRGAAVQDGLIRAIDESDTAKVFDELNRTFSFQGISDQVARGYLYRYGSPSYQTVERGLKSAKCPLLQSHWQFHGCRFDKSSCSCSEPDQLPACPLPTHKLRNGRLNQTTYSLFLFIRDIAAGDLVAWLDAQIRSADPEDIDGQISALVGPMRNIFGVSDKILTMTLSSLLIAGAQKFPHWMAPGAGMIAIDTLVHNFLHRTGVLADFGAEHLYGAACYQPAGCRQIICEVSKHIDVRGFGIGFPQRFPRFVQHAIWRYCAGDGLGICNGNRIDDRKSCQNHYCFVFKSCSHRPLKPSNNKYSQIT